MNNKLYNLMNWPDIEGIVYSDTDSPQKLLGGHVCEEGFLIQTFNPHAVEMKVKIDGKSKIYPMQKVDEAGYYAVLIPGKRKQNYTFISENVEGEQREYKDAYAFDVSIDNAEIRKFRAGINYEIYRILGAHCGVINGVRGTRFAIWMPDVQRVSVVGDFCKWDGRVFQMMKHDGSSVYELFIPGVEAGSIYKYEVRKKDGSCMLITDPYARAVEDEGNAAVVCGDDDFVWSDDKWMALRKMEDTRRTPASIYQTAFSEDSCSYVENAGYTHVELMPIAEYPYDGSWGYQVTGYYAPTSRYGSPKDFMYFVDYLHNEGIGVILDWVPAHFPKDAHGLANFDGSCVYEYADPRKGEHPDWGTKVFDYEKNEVCNFLIANALFWVDRFHVDGLRFDAVASMLYLDYGRTEGNWVPNKYGKNGNLEAMSFLKHCNSILRKRFPRAVTIAEESTAWPHITGNPDDGESLGFTYKWNMGWMHDFLEYMKLDPYFRKFNHSKITFSLMYAYSEKFVLVLSHDEVVHLKCSMLGKMPGDLTDKFANLKLAYAYMMGHPGKKLMFMGQDFGQWNEWSEKKALDWYLLGEGYHKDMQQFTKKCLHLYEEYPAMYATDYDGDGFRWINANDKDNSTYSFMRLSPDGRKNLLFVLNFTPVARDNFRVGVPVSCKYKLVLGSDENNQAKELIAQEGDCDGYENSILIDMPRYGVAVYEFDGDVRNVNATKLGG